MTEFGWKRRDGELEIVWESHENQERAQQKIDYVLKGCKCSKTGCHNKKCKCKRGGRYCGPSCQCVNCTNYHGGTGEWTELHQLEVEGQGDNGEDEEYIEDSECEESDQEISDEEVNKIMESVFGEDIEGLGT